MLIPAMIVPTPEIGATRVIIDATSGEKRAGERRITHPSGASEIADEQRKVDQQGAAAVSQKLTELSTGNATSRAPICSGAQNSSTDDEGIATKKIMIVPCAEKI